MMFSIFRQKGFSLLELLVAFAIVGISIGLIYRSLGSLARTTSDMALRQQAAMLGKSLLSIYDDIPPDGVHQTGQRGAFKWEISSIVYALPPAYSKSQLSANPATRLHELFFLIQWDQGGRVGEWRYSTLMPERTVAPIGGSK